MVPLSNSLKPQISPGPPCILIEGRTLPEVWEAAVIQLARKGVRMPTEYDPKEQSLDAMMLMVVHDPLAEPRVHSGAAVGSLSFYDEYVEEILKGINDDEVFKGKLSYTYHQRLFDYTVEDGFGNPNVKGTGLDQLAYVVKKLTTAPYSRRAQSITWNPFIDTFREDPPCLQRLWFRIYGENHNQFLVMHSHWRSRDALHAAFLNMYALTLLQAQIADQLSKHIGTEIKVGQYIDVSDSFHIYERTQEDLNRFIKTVKTLQPAQKFWTTTQLRKLISQATGT